MLALDDLNWILLYHAYGSAEDIPEMILNLEKNNKAGDDTLFYGCLCHQYSLYSATFAAIPHLVRIMQQTSNTKLKYDILVFCGVVYAYDFWENYTCNEDTSVLRDLSGPISTELLLEIQRDYFYLASIIHETSLNLLNQEGITQEDKESILLTVAAVNQCGAFARVCFECPSSNKEYVCTCPNCVQELYIWPKENTLISYSDDPTFVKNQKGIVIQPTQIHTNTWNGQYNREQLPYWLKSLAASSMVSYFEELTNHLFGTVNCNHCRVTFILIDRLEEEF